jgi:hypothetical protein
MIKAVITRNHDINEKSDELTDRIRVVEQRLDEAGIRVTVWLDTVVLEEREGGWQVGYAFIRGYEEYNTRDRWGFVCRRGADDRVTQLVRAPRKVRVAAALYLSDVVTCIHARMEEMHDAVKAATGEVKKLIEGENEAGRDSERDRRRVRTRR